MFSFCPCQYGRRARGRRGLQGQCGRVAAQSIESLRVNFYIQRAAQYPGCERFLPAGALSAEVSAPSVTAPSGIRLHLSFRAAHDAVQPTLGVMAAAGDADPLRDVLRAGALALTRG